MNKDSKSTKNLSKLEESIVDMPKSELSAICRNLICGVCGKTPEVYSLPQMKEESNNARVIAACCMHAACAVFRALTKIGAMVKQESNDPQRSQDRAMALTVT